MSNLQSAIRYSIEGPLHKAILTLEEILRSNPSEKSAVMHLADVYCRLGRYEDAVSLFSRIRKQGYWDAEMENEERRIIAIWEDLRKVEKIRFKKKMFLSHAIVPNGKGGYYVDTLGFPGTWDIYLNTSGELLPGAYLRLFKSLAWVTQQIRIKESAPPRGYPPQQFDYGGDASVEEYLEENISISFLKNADNLFRWHVAVDTPFLYWDRERQRREITRRLAEGSFHVLSEDSKTDSTDLPTQLPRLVLISPGLSSDYAVAMLRDRSTAQGIPTVASYIRSHKHVEDYLNIYAGLPEFDHEHPDIFAIGVLDVMVEEVCVLIDGLRRKFPHAYIIIGGPTSQTPEQFAAVVPDFDILIRGDGDEVLPEIAKIIGRTDRRDGMSESQLTALQALPGGLIVQHRSRRIVHRLDFTNIPKTYHLAKPDKKKTIYYWQTSRGCPYDCRFCYKWSGKRYHMVVPWNNDPVEAPLERRSALAMKEFLLARLALEWPSGIALTDLEDLLKQAKSDRKILELPELKERVFIVIEDDDFLINRQRVREFCGIINELALQNYFDFSAITSVRTLFREGATVDQETLELLREANFISLDIGSDGLCQRTIEENQKGYTLDNHVIPLNMHLKQMGFFAFNNTIITTPYTTMPQLIESLIFYILCPYPINTAIQFGIMGHVGTKYTNEDIVNQQYEWRGQEGLDKGHVKIMDRYRVPIDFPEYAINSSHMIDYADPKIFELVAKLPQNDPVHFLRHEIPAEETETVVKLWMGASDGRPEVKSLGKSLHFLLEQHESWDIGHAILVVKEEMSMLNLSSFHQYHERLRIGQIRSDPLYISISRKMTALAQLKKEHNWKKAEEELTLLVKETPWYFRLHRELIMLLINQGQIAKAVERFAGYQVIYPDILFYFMFFSQFLEKMNLYDAHGKERALFHYPRYYTISPIYYFLALIKDSLGSDVKEIRTSDFMPGDVEKLYDHFELLTIGSMKQVIDESPLDLSKQLQSGREVYAMGIPVRYLKEEQKVLIDYGRIKPDLAYDIQ